MDKVKIGQRIAALRKERGETTIEVAAALNICQSALSMYENGSRVPRDDIKIRISKHFGVPVGEIFFTD